MPKKILLADDSVTIQKVVELTFSEGDYSVTSVSNGKLAIEQLTKDRPDLVIVDIIMPEMSGYDVAEYIKKNPQFSAIPVILLTGTFEPFDEERAKKTGAETYVTKPFDSKMLVEKVESLLAQKVKVEDVGKIPPATIFQSRQEYEVPGVVSDRYIEEMKAESEQEFPKVEELKKEETPVSPSIAADFIPSVDEIQAPPVEESPIEATAISGENLPPSDFEGFEAISEPPLPNFEAPSQLTEQSFEGSPASPETPVAQEQIQSQEFREPVEQESTKEEYVTESLQTQQPDLEIKESMTETPSAQETPSFEEGVVEIPSPPAEEIKQEEALASETLESPQEPISSSFSSQESVIEVGESKEPSFLESAPSFETPFVPETPEIVTDLSEQVMMVAEGQQKAEEMKEEPSAIISETTDEQEEEKTPFEETSPEKEEPLMPQEEKSLSMEAEEKEEPVRVEEEKPLEKTEGSSVSAEKVEVSPEILENIVRKVVEELAPSIIKDIAWEVIPDLANAIIKKRIEELEKETEK